MIIDINTYKDKVKACFPGKNIGGTPGALMGIMGGTEIIDEKWLVPIGDEIKTISVDRTKINFFTGRLPSTVSELKLKFIRSRERN